MNSKKSNEKRTSRQVIFTDINDLNTFLAVKTISKLNMEHGVKLAIEILKKLSVVLHVLHTTQSLVISPCCFAEDA